MGFSGVVLPLTAYKYYRDDDEIMGVCGFRYFFAVVYFEGLNNMFLGKCDWQILDSFKVFLEFKINWKMLFIIENNSIECYR